MISDSKNDSLFNNISEFWLHAINNEENKELQEFAIDMVDYAMFVSPQEYGQSSIMQHVPFDYREEIGFHKFLNFVHSKIDEEDSVLNPDVFVTQFLQHNPDELSSLKDSDIKEGSTKKDNKPSETIVLKSTKEKNSTSKRLLRSQDSENEVFPDYVSYFVNSKYGKQIYKFSGLDFNGRAVYNRIDKLGYRFMTEYNPYTTETTESIVLYNKLRNNDTNNHKIK
jgi:hypothetical protein